MKWLLLCVACWLTSCTSSPTATKTESKSPDLSTQLPNDAAKAYLDGKMLILYGYSDSTTTSEAFADWQAYLHDYLSSADSFVYHSRITTSSLSKISGLPDFDTEFTLFIKRGHPVITIQIL